MATYQIKSTGNRILADQDFMDQHYPNDYTLIPEPEPDPKLAILAQLAEIDADGDKPRTRREALLGNITYLEALNKQATELREKLKG